MIFLFSLKAKFEKKNVAAVSCSSRSYRFSWGGICVLVDGQGGPCMASVHGWCMGVWGFGVSDLGVTCYGGGAVTGGSLK